MNHVHQTEYLGPKLNACKKICISDCANTSNLEQLSNVILFVKKIFAEESIKLVFHRGTGRLKPEFVEFVQKNKIDYVDISGSLEGIKVYDDCDLHIGYRVHAHIYI